MEKPDEIAILEVLGGMQCTEIDDPAMIALVKDRFPKDAEPSTINRHLYAWVIACLRVALKEKTPKLERPKGAYAVKPVKTAPNEWFEVLMPELDNKPNLRALVAFLSCHGRRISDALRRKPSDLRGNALDLGITKNGTPRQVTLHPLVLDQIHAMPDWQSRQHLFGFGPKSHGAVRCALIRACERAGVPFIPCHTFGRHTSVKGMLDAGYSVKHVAGAHGMSPELVLRVYGHLEVQETTRAMHQVGGARLAQALNRREIVGEEAERKRLPAPATPLIPRDNSTL